jgi:hypothetical protein
MSDYNIEITIRGVIYEVNLETEGEKGGGCTIKKTQAGRLWAVKKKIHFNFN